jgi:hypothetical protein
MGHLKIAKEHRLLDSFLRDLNHQRETCRFCGGGRVRGTIGYIHGDGCRLVRAAEALATLGQVELYHLELLDRARNWVQDVDLRDQIKLVAPVKPRTPEPE